MKLGQDRSVISDAEHSCPVASKSNNYSVPSFITYNHVSTDHQLACGLARLTRLLHAWL